MNVVIDTSALINRPDIVHQIKNAHIYLPLVVIEELEKLKADDKRLRVASRARRAIRVLDELRNVGKLYEGVTLFDTNSVVQAVELEEYPAMIFGTGNDSLILRIALFLNQEQKVALVSDDLAMRVRAEASGIESLTSNDVCDEGFHGGEVIELYYPGQVVDQLYAAGVINVSDENDLGGMIANQYANVRSYEHPSRSALVRYSATLHSLELVRGDRIVWGIKGKNREQRCAIDALDSQDIPVVVLTGPSGTGKTLLTLAVAFEKTLQDNKFKKILVTRPIIPIGRDLGFLPGDKTDKMTSWLEGITDNAEFLLGSKDEFAMYADQGKIEIESITYMRGRSLQDSFIIIDEAQNASPEMIKTILTRVGKNSKIVILGDTTQIDNSRLDEHSNGLSYLIERAKDTDLVTHVNLVDCSIRSEVAAWAVHNL